jgi:hypothetical protein
MAEEANPFYGVSGIAGGCGRGQRTAFRIFRLQALIGTSIRRGWERRFRGGLIRSHGAGHADAGDLRADRRDLRDDRPVFAHPVDRRFRPLCALQPIGPEHGIC